MSGRRYVQAADCIGSFVHISDLHIGTPNVATGDAEASRLLSYSKLFRGVLGHEYRALDLVRRFLKHPPTALIVTGDLTRVGHPDEFSLACDYIHSTAHFGGERATGLEGAGEEVLTIPGNHDHWPGMATIFGRPTAGLGKLPECPYSGRVVRLDHGYVVHFMGIDTDDQVPPFGTKRLLARGAFRRQLERLNQQLGPAVEKEIRVLLMHHSPANTGRVLGIELASRQALADFIEDQGIAVILTGHMHAPHVAVGSFAHSKPAVQALEARCGSTSVLRTLPLSWRAYGFRPLGSPHDNCLLFHRLIGNEESLYWRVDTLQQKHDGFRTPDKPIPHGAGEFRVWPLAR